MTDECFTANCRQAQCQVFATTFNPQAVRMGNKVLRQRLKGPAVAAYYPRKTATVKDVKREFGPILATWDEAEEDRFEYIEEYEREPNPMHRDEAADTRNTGLSNVERARQRRRRVLLVCRLQSRRDKGTANFSDSCDNRKEALMSRRARRRPAAVFAAPEPNKRR